MAEGNDSGDWRVEGGSVFELWEVARVKKFHTDVTFLVGEKETEAESFPAHRIVLSINSSVFEAMFYGSLEETTNPIAVTDVDPDVFRILIGFMYGGKADFSTVIQAIETYLAADKYHLTDLQAAVECYVMKTVLDDIIFWKLVNKEKHIKIPFIKEKCLSYIWYNAKYLFQCYLFLNISFDVIEEIVKMNDIPDLTEYELLLAIVRWGTANVEPGTTLRSILNPLLEYIRFSNFSTGDYCNFLDNNPGLIDANDALMILKHLTKPKIYKLPQWCSTYPERRHDLNSSDSSSASTKL